MKTKKSVKMFAVFFALLAVMLAGCSSPSSQPETILNDTNANNSNTNNTNPNTATPSTANPGTANPSTVNPSSATPSNTNANSVNVAGTNSSGGNGQTFKVELGDISFADYMEFEEWQMNVTSISYEIIRAEKDVLRSQTKDGTYQDRGTVTFAELNEFLAANDYDDDMVDSIVSIVNRCGNDIVAVFSDEIEHDDVLGFDVPKKTTWVYIEK